MNKIYSTMVQSRNSARLTKRPNFKQKAAPTPPSAKTTGSTTTGGTPNNNPFDSSDDDLSPTGGGPTSNQPHHYVNRGPWPPPSASSSTNPPVKPIKTIPRQKYNLTATVIYECIADEPDELSFKVGDIITNIREAEEEGWVIGTCRGKSGLVPRNHLNLPKSNV